MDFQSGKTISLPIGDQKFNSEIQDVHGNQCDVLLRNVPKQTLEAWIGGNYSAGGTTPRQRT